MAKYGYRTVRALMFGTAMLGAVSAAQAHKPPKVADIVPTRTEDTRSAVAAEFDASNPAIRRVHLSGDFFALKPLGGEMPPEIANAKVRIDFAGQTPTFDDLTQLLEDRGLEIILGWDDGTYGVLNGLGPSSTSSAGSAAQNSGGFGSAGYGNQNYGGNSVNSSGSGGGFGTSQQTGLGNNGSSSGSGFGVTQTSGNGTNGSNGVNGQSSVSGLGVSNGGGMNSSNGGFGSSSGSSGFGSNSSGSPFGGSNGSNGSSGSSQSANSIGAQAVTAIRGRPLPFRRYEGTLGGLFRQLQRSMGVTVWWNDGVYVSPVGRYSVLLPQNKDLMQQVVDELKAKGASNVVASIQAGTISFVAPGALADEVIRPYLIQLGRNASEITMQVALVSVNMTENTAKGFDWSQFSTTFGVNAASSSSSATSTGTSVGSGTTTTGTTTTTSTQQTTPLGTLSTTAAQLFIPGVHLFGTKQPLSIMGAIDFLSTYGNTSVDQNVELRTLAGTAVNWRSGETIPYVSGVSATTSGVNTGSSSGLDGAVGSAQTAQLETGLSLTLAPTYESNGGLVTVSFNLELVELEQFVNLSAGNQLGSFTQPQTRDQKMDDIVRVPVGETVVLGGLRVKSTETDRNAPFSFYAIGSKTKKNGVQTTFVLMRPSVTTYEIGGLDQSFPSASSTSMGADGRPWSAPLGADRGAGLFGGPADQVGPVVRRSMAQPSQSGRE